MLIAIMDVELFRPLASAIDPKQTKPLSLSDLIPLWSMLFPAVFTYRCKNGQVYANYGVMILSNCLLRYRQCFF